MHRILKLDGFSNGDILVNSPPVFIQRVKSVDPIIKERFGTANFIAKTCIPFNEGENKKIDYEGHIISKIHEDLVANFSVAEVRYGLSPGIKDITEVIYENQLFTESKPSPIPFLVKIEKNNDSPVLLFKDTGMIPLRLYLQTDSSLHSIVKIMAMVADGLALIHSAKFAHLDINFDCFFVKNGEEEHAPMSLQIFDYRNALYVGESGATFYFNTENNASYISPEQSGRMSKKIDTRSDIYSLGVLFWETLVKSHPFDGADTEVWRLFSAQRSDEL